MSIIDFITENLSYILANGFDFIGDNNPFDLWFQSINFDLMNNGHIFGSEAIDSLVSHIISYLGI